jgi:hypothetical protein
MAHPSQAISITSSSEDSLPPSTPLEKLRLAVTEYPTNYCCGGEIPITTEKITRSATSAYQPIRTPPVTIRWDVSNEPGNAHTVHLPFNTPLEGANADVNAASMQTPRKNVLPPFPFAKFANPNPFSGYLKTPDRFEKDIEIHVKLRCFLIE